LLTKRKIGQKPFRPQITNAKEKEKMNINEDQPNARTSIIIEKSSGFLLV
jgi:hypothetical protein